MGPGDGRLVSPRTPWYRHASPGGKAALHRASGSRRNPIFPEESRSMAQRCDVCGKGPVVGNQISHAHNVSARRWLPNLVSMRAVVKGRAKRVRV
ncbi:MAG: 50S ribosomal protein L28, partial [Candidatus Rokuibacteriota bacterium]